MGANLAVENKGNCCNSTQVCRFRGAFWTIRILKLTGHFSESRNLIPHQFAIHGGRKKKEKELGKTTLFRQLNFSTRES